MSAPGCPPQIVHADASWTPQPLLVTAFIVFFFTFWPVYKIDAKHGQRNVAAWKAACDAYDVGALTKLGLS